MRELWRRFMAPTHMDGKWPDKAMRRMFRWGMAVGFVLGIWIDRTWS